MSFSCNYPKCCIFLNAFWELIQKRSERQGSRKITHPNQAGHIRLCNIPNYIVYAHGGMSAAQKMKDFFNESSTFVWVDIFMFSSVVNDSGYPRRFCFHVLFFEFYRSALPCSIWICNQSKKLWQGEKV